MKEVSKLAGVSTATISKYINGIKVKEKNRENIEKAIKELDFTINTYARALRKNKSMTIGVLIPELGNQFSTSIVSRIENTLMESGYSTIICDCNNNGETEDKKLEFLLSKKCDALVILPYNLKLERIFDFNLPVVLIDRVIEGMNCDSVLIDNIGASYNAVKFLFENGHKDIAVLCGPHHVYTVQKRLQGYKQAFLDYNIPINDNYIFHGEYDVQTGYNLTDKILKMKKRPTAIYATNSEITLGSVIALNENNIDIPNEISLLGFDNLDIANAVKPKISVITQPINEIGELVAKILIDRLSGKNAIKKTTNFLKTNLFIGNSVRKLGPPLNIQKNLSM